MYSLLEKTDYYNKITNKAIKWIKKDRDNYNDIMQLIYKFCKDNNLIISNLVRLADDNNQINILKKQSLLIYSLNPFKHANDLCNLMFKQCQIKTCDITRLRTVVPYKEFIIDFDTRPLVNIISPSNDKRHNPIIPVIIDGLKYVPPELELIDLYKKLFTIYSKTDILYEKNLFSKCKKSFKENTPKDIKNSVKLSLFEFLKKEKDIVFTNHWGKAILANQIMPLHEKLQIVSTKHPDELLRILKDKWSDIISNTIDINVPTDTRSGRVTYYIDNKPVLDLYNIATYNVISYFVYKKINIATKYVNLMLLFIDLFVLSNIKIDVSHRIKTTWNSINFYKEYEKEHDILYIGIHRDEQIDKKNKNSEHAMKNYPYYPYLYKKNNNTFRIIGKTKLD